jgi:uncharacterized protein with PQ loop repeat
METVGWIGSILFAICGLPQAIECWRQGHSRGLSWAFLLCWFGGEVLTIAYVLPKADMPLLFNYFMNLGFLLVMLKFKMWERK